MSNIFDDIRREGRMEGFRLGIEECIKENEKTIRQNGAIYLAKKGDFTAEEIVDMTGLSIEQIEKIIGMQETKKKIALRMLAAGKYTVEEIADLIVWSTKEVKSLKQNVALYDTTEHAQ